MQTLKPRTAGLNPTKMEHVDRLKRMIRKALITLSMKLVLTEEKIMHLKTAVFSSEVRCQHEVSLRKMPLS